MGIVGANCDTKPYHEHALFTLWAPFSFEKKQHKWPVMHRTELNALVVYFFGICAAYHASRIGKHRIA